MSVADHLLAGCVAIAFERKVIPELPRGIVIHPLKDRPAEVFKVAAPLPPIAYHADPADDVIRPDGQEVPIVACRRREVAFGEGRWPVWIGQERETGTWHVCVPRWIFP